FVVKNRTHPGEVYICDADGSSRKQLTTPPPGPPTICLGPSWSADGKQIAYARADPNQAVEVRVVAADGSDDRLLAAGATRPAWSADGKTSAFVRAVKDKPCSICTAAPDGSGEKVLVENAGRAYPSIPAWSPDGRVLAYSAETPAGLQLFVIPAAGGTPRQ